MARAEIVVETFGVPAHSANPEKGVNAVYKMCEAIQAIREIEPPVQDKLGKGILELTDVRSFPYPGASVVPEYCRATYDRRLLVGETKESVLQPIIEKMEELKKKDPQFSYKFLCSGKRGMLHRRKNPGRTLFPRLAVWRRRGVGSKNKIRTGKRGIFSKGNYLQFLYKWKPLCRRSWHTYYWNGTCKRKSGTYH